MSEKGTIRRFNSLNSTPSSQIQPYSQTQKHLEKFLKLIANELNEETSALEFRWKNWTKKQLKEAGITLFGLRGRKNGLFFGENILSFSEEKGVKLPFHQFSHGDMVVISRSQPWKEKVHEGIVLDRNSKRIRIVVSEAPNDIRKGNWRLDRSANRVAHDRMKDALLRFHSSEGDQGTTLRDLLLNQVHDLPYSAKQSPEITKSKSLHKTKLKHTLNKSQQSVIDEAKSERLNLIQGPPGTGKTYTAVRLLHELTSKNSTQILATAESNVAVDNLLQGLLELGINAVRIGKPVKVRENLRKATLDYNINNHPLNEELEIIQDENRAIQIQLPKLRGKEKGLAHKDIHRNQKEIKNIERRITEEILGNAEVICCTNIGAGHHILGERKFPIVLIDEATQASEPSALVPITRGCRQLFLVGDHKQLPPTVLSKDANGLKVSLFERLIDSNLEPKLLNTQYRMHPVIREFPSMRFYDNKLLDGAGLENRDTPAGFIWPDWDAPVAFVPVTGHETQDEFGKSRSNIDEAALTMSVLDSLLAPGDLSPEDVGIISPYAAQIRLLNSLAEESKNPEIYAGVEMQSVDGFQGREKEVIIMSTVRSNPTGELGFLKDARRLNVAITRAKRGLIIIGNPVTLSHDHNWKGMLDWIEERNLMAWHMVHT